MLITLGNLGAETDVVQRAGECIYNIKKTEKELKKEWASA